jgi:hypothetical protein
MGWVLLTNPATGGVHLVPEGGTVGFEAHGWERRSLPAGMDADDPNAPAALDELLALEVLENAKRLKASAKQPTKTAASATDKKE